MLLGTMRFFDAHCDTIGKIWEGKADFASESGRPPDGHAGGDTLHVTLPGLRKAGVRGQVFASWAWTEKYKGREFEVGMAKVEAVQRLCNEYPADLFLALTGAAVAAACAAPEPGPPSGPAASDASGTRVAVVASLEGADSLQGEVDNLAVFHRAGVRLLTLAWHDSVFCGSSYGEGTGLTAKGADLVGACEQQHVLVDVSHASDQAFADICRVATRPFIASHSNCRALCPSPRNFTDEMIRAVAERGGVVGITLAPGFLSTDYYRQTKGLNEEFWRSIADGTATVDEAGQKSSAAEALIPRPPLDLIAHHVLHAINAGGEDAVGLEGTSTASTSCLPASRAWRATRASQSC